MGRTVKVIKHTRNGVAVPQHNRRVNDATSKSGAGRELDSMNGGALKRFGLSQTGGVPGADTDINGNMVDSQNTFNLESGGGVGLDAALNGGAQNSHDITSTNSATKKRSSKTKGNGK